MGSRYHARVALLYAIETSLVAEGASPEEIEISLRRSAEMGDAQARRRRLSARGEAARADRGPARQADRRHHAASVIAGEVALEDLRITPAALRMQAEIARSAGRPMLAENFERAAEMVDVPQDFLMQVYELLRPGRAKDKAPLLAAARDTAGDLRRGAHGALRRGSGGGLRAPRAVHLSILRMARSAETSPRVGARRRKPRCIGANY